MWPSMAVAVILVVVAAAWFAFGRRTSGPGNRAVDDPLAKVGLGIALAGAVTIPTLGSIMLLVTLVGVGIIVVAQRWG